MTTATDIIRAAEAELCRPWLRHILSHAEWAALAQAASAETWTLLAHWADTLQAHALLLNPHEVTIVPVSTPVTAGHYPALSPALPTAAWYERMIHDLWGHTPDGAVDLRPWLDHGNWPLSPPMATRPEPNPPDEPAPEAPQASSLPNTPSGPDSEPAMVLPLGPVWGRLEEAAHLRLTLLGPAIRRAEARLGFAHKGVLTLMRGKSPRAAARFAARLSADATVAHSVAFAQATESAMDVAAPPRAMGLRIVMMEIERIAVHLDNLAEVGRLAASQTVWTRCGYLREILLRAADFSFGHRLMMDCVVPGGVASDIAEGGTKVILRALGSIASEIHAIRRLHEGAAVSSCLVGLGRASATLTAALGVSGIVGRASGSPFDIRNGFSPGYRDLMPIGGFATGATRPAKTQSQSVFSVTRLLGLAAMADPDARTRLASTTPHVRALHPSGDAAARQHLRIFEIQQSLGLIGMALDILPAGPVTVALPQVSGEGIAATESTRGDVWHWLRLDHGQIATAFVRDPGWALWPLAERVLEHASIEDIALIRASLALPASGMDL